MNFETVRFRPEWHRKIALHRGFVLLEVQFQNFWFVVVGDSAQAVFALDSPFFERDFTRGFGIPHPLRAPARCYQKGLAAKLKKVHRRGVNTPALSSAHLKQTHVIGPNAQSHQKPERPIEKRLHGIRLPKRRRLQVVPHPYILNDSLIRGSCHRLGPGPPRENSL